MRYTPGKCNAWYSERNAAIVAAYQRGEKLAQIADYWRLSPKTVSEILRGYGLKRAKGRW
mgnify:CR=1 FL=1